MGLYRRLGLCVSLREEPPEHPSGEKGCPGKGLPAANRGSAALLSTTEHGELPVSLLERPRHKGLGCRATRMLVT